MRSPTPQQRMLDYQLLKKYDDDDLESFIKVITPQVQSLARLQMLIINMVRRLDFKTLVMIICYLILGVF